MTDRLRVYRPDGYMGALLVEGPRGSGKTSALLRWIHNIVEESDHNTAPCLVICPSRIQAERTVRDYVDRHRDTVESYSLYQGTYHVCVRNGPVVEFGWVCTPRTLQGRQFRAAAIDDWDRYNSRAAEGDVLFALGMTLPLRAWGQDILLTGETF